MGNNSAKMNPETTKMEHPLTTAILERNLSLLLDLVAEHLDSIENIKVSFPNEEERANPSPLYYFNWRFGFVPEKIDHLETPLETASRIGWLEGVELLLDRGVSPRHEKRKAFHDPPCALLWACKRGHADVVKLLLEKGADVECFHKHVDSQDETRTPLAVALHYQRLPLLKVLIDAGANINKPVWTGARDKMQPPLALTLLEGRMEFIKLLIGAGVDITPNGWDGASSTAGLDGWTRVIAFNLYLQSYRCLPDAFSTEFLVLWMQAGGTINAEMIIGYDENLDLSQEHPGDRLNELGRQANVKRQLQPCIDGTLYRLTILDMCRIVIRKKLIEHARGKSILPAIKSLPLPMKMKTFLSFDNVKSS